MGGGVGAAAPPGAAPRPLVAVGGGGTSFFWQLGAARALVDARRRGGARGDAGELEWAGSSAGALCAVLSACDVCPEAATRAAARVAAEAGVRAGPAALAGVWGGLIRAWLEELLPDDAAARCSRRVTVQFCVVRSCRRGGVRMARVREFATRAALIDALLASVHLPLFLDGRLFCRIAVDGRVERACDGGVMRLIPFGGCLFGIPPTDLLVRSAADPVRAPDYYVNFRADAEYMRNRPGLTELVGVDVAVWMVKRGYQFTAACVDGGHLRTNGARTLLETANSFG